jgi:cell wall-associated NlpC family hydrolase
MSSLKPGDLVGFGDGGHTAIWLGDNQVLEAPRSGENVRIRSLGQNESVFGVSLDNWYK